MKNPNNLTIFDQAERKKQEGMEAAYQYADVDWKRIAAEAVRECALTKPEFSSDDVWDRIYSTGVTTHENRAMGAVMQAAARAGIIKRTGNYRPTRNIRQHKQPIAIWQSLVYKPQR